MILPAIERAWRTASSTWSSERTSSGSLWMLSSSPFILSTVRAVANTVHPAFANSVALHLEVKGQSMEGFVADSQVEANTALRASGDQDDFVGTHECERERVWARGVRAGRAEAGIRARSDSDSDKCAFSTHLGLGQNCIAMRHHAPCARSTRIKCVLVARNGVHRRSERKLKTPFQEGHPDLAYRSADIRERLILLDVNHDFAACHH
jgi:hypothetical protein